MCEIKENIIRVIKDGEIVDMYHENYNEFEKEMMPVLKEKYKSFDVQICVINVIEQFSCERR